MDGRTFFANIVIQLGVAAGFAQCRYIYIDLQMLLLVNCIHIALGMTVTIQINPP